MDPFLQLSKYIRLSLSLSIYIYIYVHIYSIHLSLSLSLSLSHTHTHTHTCAHHPTQSCTGLDKSSWWHSMSDHTELLNVSICWSTNSGVSINRSPLEKIAYEFAFLSQLYLTCHSRPIWMVSEIGGKCFEKGSFQESFKQHTAFGCFFSYLFHWSPREEGSTLL